MHEMEIDEPEVVVRKAGSDEEAAPGNRRKSRAARTKDKIKKNKKVAVSIAIFVLSTAAILIFDVDIASIIDPILEILSESSADDDDTSVDEEDESLEKESLTMLQPPTIKNQLLELNDNSDEGFSEESDEVSGPANFSNYLGT